jgi:SAM-dependent methyltransferase
MWDSVWETIFSSRAWGKYPAEVLIRFIAQNYYQAPDRSKIRVLELGCGPGANLWFLAREGFSFVGIDGSATAINQAETRLDEECPGWRARGELIVGDITSITSSFEPVFDAVIDSECVYCTPYEEALGIYAESRRVLKDGGMIFVRTFNTDTWGCGTGELVDKNTYFCNEGPLAGKGLSRFTEYDDIPHLLNSFSLLHIELLSQTYLNRSKKVDEWIIIAEK